MEIIIFIAGVVIGYIAGWHDCKVVSIRILKKLGKENVDKNT